MLEFLHDLLSNNPSGAELTFFSWYHIAYILFDLVAITAINYFFLLRPRKTHEPLLWGLAIFILASYLLDLAFQPIIYLGTSSWVEAIINKLPFHLCTLNAILIMLAMIIHKQWFRNIVVLYAMFGGAIFLIAPQTYVQGGYSPFCYQVLQTFLYHGATLCWAVFAVFSGFVRPKFSYTWIGLVSLPAIGIWAEIGNTAFYTPTRNFMFLRHDIIGWLPGYWYLAEFAVIGCIVITAYFAFFDFVFPKFTRRIFSRE